MAMQSIINIVIFLRVLNGNRFLGKWLQRLITGYVSASVVGFHFAIPTI